MVPANERTDGDSGEMEAHRRNQPSAWLTLTGNQTLPLVIDALLDSPPHREFNKTELGNHAGVSRESIRTHIDTLLEFGIIEEVPDTTPQRYRLNDRGVATAALFEFNSALNEAGATEDALLPESEVVQAAEGFHLEMDFPRDDTDTDELTLPEPNHA